MQEGNSVEPQATVLIITAEGHWPVYELCGRMSTKAKNP